MFRILVVVCIAPLMQFMGYLCSQYLHELKICVKSLNVPRKAKSPSRPLIGQMVSILYLKLVRKMYVCGTSQDVLGRPLRYGYAIHYLFFVTCNVCVSD
jgi:hypothetical protein